LEPVPGTVEVVEAEAGVPVAVEAGEGSGEACDVAKDRACIVCATTVAAVLACDGATGKAQANMTAVNRTRAVKTLMLPALIFNIDLIVHQENRNHDLS
jgi:hypothetical protein